MADTFNNFNFKPLPQDPANPQFVLVVTDETNIQIIAPGPLDTNDMTISLYNTQQFETEGGFVYVASAVRTI